MDKGKLANLVKETEKGLFLANKKLKEMEKLALEIEQLFKNLAVAEQAGERTDALEKELAEQMKKRKVVAQSHQLFNALEKLRKDLRKLEELEARARPFVERHRTGRQYVFETGNAAAKFARLALEAFEVKEAFFKPRFGGTVDLSELSEKLKLKKSGDGLLLQPKDLKAFVGFMAEKRFASNISLEAPGLKLVWQDTRTINIEALPERLFRMDRLCDVLDGKCLEK